MISEALESTMEGFDKSPIESVDTSAMEKCRPDSNRAANQRETESVTNVSAHFCRVTALNKSVLNPH